MQITWEILLQDIKAVNALIKAYENHKIYIDRLQKNVTHRRNDPVSKSEFWQAILLGLLTTQQKSGTGTAVGTFLEIAQHPLSLDLCLRQGDLKTFVSEILTNNGGIRRHETIAEQVQANLKCLQSDNWNILAKINKALPFETKEAEREIASAIAQSLKGIGPKQSRNILQSLGLTRYEIPLDSRVIKWANEQHIFPFHLTSIGLADSNYYELVLDGIQVLCAAANVWPCLFDVAIFARGERDAAFMLE